MAGNVWEFVDAPDQGLHCVLRGGSFVNNDQEVRADVRLWGVLRDHRPHDFGFRCALVRNDPAS
jgi:formylglycine-generating enzyme required for sulfatase activity